MRTLRPTGALPRRSRRVSRIGPRASSEVYAFQINYADQDAELMGKNPGLYHAYRVFESSDGKTWNLLLDKSKNRQDVPHDYVELKQPVKTRFLRLENVHVPTASSPSAAFASSDLAQGSPPNPLKTSYHFVATPIAAQPGSSGSLKPTPQATSCVGCFSR